MDKYPENRTDQDIPRMAQIFSKRWSPRAFDPNTPIGMDILAVIFEAARWAPSSSNEQPWRYIIGQNFDKSHQDILATLNENNQVWAQNAPVLFIACAKLTRNDRPSRTALHDLGLSSQNLALQAHELNVYCHIMGGFSRELARDLFQIPQDFEPVTAGALGFPGQLDKLSEDLREREASPRTRMELHEFVYDGTWGLPLTFP